MPGASQVETLRSPEAVRDRCRRLTDLVAGGIGHWEIHRDRLDSVADRVAEMTRQTYPDLRIPLHSRWRHFQAGGVDRPSALPTSQDPVEQGRRRVGLVVVSVLLDAGAGTDWSYQDETGHRHQRSEGLAIASFEAFARGGFSSSDAPAADSGGLLALTEQRLREIFQVTGDNPLIGLQGRLGLLYRLGEVAGKLPGERVGGIYDLVVAKAREGRVSATQLLGVLLRVLSELWPDSIQVDGKPMGDVWPHPALGTDAYDLVPFHKLMQWLAYSLVEPLGEGGVEVTELDSLTPLAEYRNGGLLIDGGVIVPRDWELLETVHAPSHEAIVEWRALTVTLIEEVAQLVRARLGRPDLSLGQILEGGTWRAGRALAAERRPGGGPPIKVKSDGTLF